MSRTIRRKNKKTTWFWFKSEREFLEYKRLYDEKWHLIEVEPLKKIDCYKRRCIWSNLFISKCSNEEECTSECLANKQYNIRVRYSTERLNYNAACFFAMNSKGARTYEEYKRTVTKMDQRDSHSGRWHAPRSYRNILERRHRQAERELIHYYTEIDGWDNSCFNKHIKNADYNWF